MFKATLEYVDYNEQPRVEDFYFNLSPAEFVRMEMEVGGGLEFYTKKIAGERDPKVLWGFFEKVVLMAYGEKTVDGKRFIKEEGRLAKEFVETDAFSILVIRLIGEDGFATKFFEGIQPKAPSDRLAKAKEDGLSVSERNERDAANRT